MNEFVGISVSTLNAWLTEAQSALHSLAIGGKVVSISSADGKRISFTPAETKELRAYVLRLQRAVSIATGVSSPLGISVATWTR